VLVLRRAFLSFTAVALGLAGAGSAALVTGPAPDATTTATFTADPASTFTVPSTENESTAPFTVVISGHGWGHGLGMSQWGTLGYARQGWSYRRILAHYYRGTTLQHLAGPTVRVLLAEGSSNLSLSSPSKWSVTDVRGKKLTLPAGGVTVGARLVIAGTKLVSPVTFSTKQAPLVALGKPYRGLLRVYSDGKRVQLVNVLRLETYVRGVVGHEMPDDWPIEALKAQAVAARSYALATRAEPDPARPFDLYNDTRSQVYGGIEAESPAVTAAVAATAGQVLSYGGRIIPAYYSASSGGRTSSAAEIDGRAVPYLVSVPDPYDTLSPYHDWGPLLFDARAIAKAMKLRGTLTALETTPGPSGHVTSVTAVGASGSVTASGVSMRRLLGLRSTWFTVGLLSLERPARIAPGAAMELVGVARGLGPVMLEARPKAGGSWETVAAVKPDASGAFSVTVEPERTTQYRLAAGDVRAGLVTLRVGGS
jgi:stage II sporulation protein D